MRPERVVDVTGSGPGGGTVFGSGCLVGDGLVLTARHVVVDAASGRAARGLAVRSLEDDRARPCEVAWAGTDRLDAALLRVVDPQGSRAGPVRWGQVASATGKVACEAIGFPRAMAQTHGPDAGTRDTERFTGRVNAGTGLLGGRLHVSADDQVPERGGWQGMSGAALWAGELLIGVIVADPPAWRARRLVAEPVSLLWAEPGFREALGPGAVLESVEFAGPPRVAASSPAYLLRADAQTVRFRSRVRELVSLTRWCDGGGLRVRLLTGPGGQGKTRLAEELCQRLEQTPDPGPRVEERWFTTWWNDRPAGGGHGRSRALERPDGPVLVVLDYAETRPDVVAEVVGLAHRAAAAGATVRVLLLARSAGDWWQRLMESDGLLEQVLDGALVEELAPLETEPGAVPVAYDEALADLDAALTTMGWPHHPPSAVPPLDDRAAGRFTGPGAALSLQMNALAALLGEDAEPEPATGTRGPVNSPRPPDPPVEPGEGVGPGGPVEEVILRHERRYWRNSARHHGLTLTDLTLRRAVAVATLCGASGEDQAVALLEQVPRLGDQSEDVRLALARWLRDLYPPAGTPAPDRFRATPPSPASPSGGPSPGGWHDGGPVDSAAHNAYWSPLQPDRLAEHLVASMVSECPGWLRQLAGHTSPDQDFQALTVLARAWVRHHEILPEVVAMIAAQPAVAAIAMRVATQSEDPTVLLSGLTALLRDTGLPLLEATALADLLPQRTRALSGFAVDITSSLAGMFERLAASAPDTYLPILANVLNKLSVRLGAAGRSEEGLAANRRAASIYQRLAEDHVHLAAFADALNNQSNLLGHLGRHEEGLATIRRTVEIRERLVGTDPDAASSSALANSLTSMSNILASLGRYEEGLITSRRANAIHERLAESAPDAHLPDLAASLNNLSIHLGELGRYEEGLAAILRAVEIRERLAGTDPDAHLPDLAGSLSNLSIRLGELGRHEEALAPAERATRTYERLAETDPAAYLPGLAYSLNNLTTRLYLLSRYEEALVAGQRAVQVCERLAEAAPDAHLHHLAAALNNLSAPLRELGRLDEGLAVVLRAVHVYEPQAAANPDAHLHRLAGLLNNVADLAGELGRRDEAVAVLRRAIGIYEPLMETHPDRFSLDLFRCYLTGDKLAPIPDPRERATLLISTLTIALDRGHEPMAEAAAQRLHDLHRTHPTEVTQTWRELTETDPPDWLLQN
ncbi:hypothetical protein Ssi03_34090 [Sphaerisporangium siamense]|uniref:Tetratricopeptide (TPR) repeat protein n=1 Tax=Sphaerisporangium siamense TaxID=795645 RepID=A0A7W7D1C6_9ACTN|nr:tetratricopeptide repeat-containing serine protease family protein [Sphaerisporangium siamense]MBB4698520.1 tetratricopeptide (TPR) repeat protein [Sphaerisporangium siamense]GII85419.1 hypothetical protein Ssi03_34090 [Sphaerisporangium siamense]